MAPEEYRTSNLGWAAATIVFIIVTSVALGYIARFIARWRGATPEGQRKAFMGYAFAGPWIIGFIVFVVGPSLISFYYSFTNYKLGNPIQWVGLENYRTLLIGQSTQTRQFGQAMFNSFYYALIGVPLQIGAALGMALLLNREIRGVRIFRTIFYLPVILAGGPALALALRYMLNSNGGFINIALKKIADSFFVFGFLYRLFIQVMEAISGIYSGLTRGDAIGPFKFFIPALIGVLALLTLVRGEWSDSKRSRALRAAELIGLFLVYSLAFRGLVAQPIDVSWTYFASVLATGFIILNAYQKKLPQVRAWQVGALILLGLGIVLTLAQGNFSADTPPYLIALVLGLIPIIVSFMGRWDRRKFMIVGGIAALQCVIMFVRAIPGQLDGGRLGLVFRYLTLQSALAQPDNLDYLKTGYPVETMSTYWIYGLVAALLVVIAVLGERYPRARRYVIYGSLVFCVLFALGSYLDGRAYFQAFDTIAQNTGSPSYHFTLYREAVKEFPGEDRVPLWMSNELWTKPALVLITMWSSGAGMLIFLAALKGVPRSLYEAAEVDGASTIQKFFRITLPMISPAMFYNIIIGVIAALQTFDTIYVIRSSAAGNMIEDSLRSAAFFLYTRTFSQLQIGEGAAISWILAAIILTITALQFRYSRWVYYEA
ncbi:MAG: sugar ABC transporter permease [Anaerolineae bacterium]|nr:sugar ABC transporter permease [Anaerolineae bacterium]